MKPADSSVPLHPLIAERWSPRGLDPEMELTDKQFLALFEAARWAPSWGNTQPARYVAGRRGQPTFDRLHGTLTRGNRGWAANAAALILGVARELDDNGEALPYGEYGLGLATENMVLQAGAEGLVAHQMAGFDAETARTEFDIPHDYKPLVVIAIGARGPADELPDKLREKELAARSRQALSELVFSGGWNEPMFDD